MTVLLLQLIMKIFWIMIDDSLAVTVDNENILDNDR